MAAVAPRGAFIYLFFFPSLLFLFSLIRHNFSPIPPLRKSLEKEERNSWIKFRGYGDRVEGNEINSMIAQYIKRILVN